MTENLIVEIIIFFTTVFALAFGLFRPLIFSLARDKKYTQATALTLFAIILLFGLAGAFALIVRFGTVFVVQQIFELRSAIPVLVIFGTIFIVGAVAGYVLGRIR